MVFVPVDVVKERMQIQVLGETVSDLPVYRSSLDAIRTILRTEGLLGIYKVLFFLHVPSFTPP